MPSGACFVFARHHQTHWQGFRADDSVQLVGRDVALTGRSVLAKRQRFGKGVRIPRRIENCVFVRKIDRASPNQLGDQMTFAAQGLRRQDDRSTVPCHRAGMHEQIRSRILRQSDSHVRIVGFENVAEVE